MLIRLLLFDGLLRPLSQKKNKQTTIGNLRKCRLEPSWRRDLSIRTIPLLEEENCFNETCIGCRLGTSLMEDLGGPENPFNPKSEKKRSPPLSPWNKSGWWYDVNYPAIKKWSLGQSETYWKQQIGKTMSILMRCWKFCHHLRGKFAAPSKQRWNTWVYIWCIIWVYMV